MLSKRNYTKEHIEDLHSRYPKVNQNVFEMTLYAFGLLQRLALSKLDFIFKGGTSLMLLLPTPKRVSTDIDILVKEGTEIGPIIGDIEHEIPLIKMVGHSSNTQNGIRVDHYSFACPPLYEKSSIVLLDVYFGDSHHCETIRKPLTNDFLINDGLPSEVILPTVDSLLGDKMTAFAPNTIGVHPFVTTFGAPCDKRLQIIKQLYDINALSEKMEDFGKVVESYRRVSEEEKKFRGIGGDLKDFVQDSFAQLFPF